MTDLNRLDELHAKATPGNWRSDMNGLYIFSDACKVCNEKQIMVTSAGFGDVQDGEAVMVDLRGWGHLQRHGEGTAISIQKATGEFIAESHNSYPSLSAELRAARERIAELEAELSAAKAAIRAADLHHQYGMKEGQP